MKRRTLLGAAIAAITLAASATASSAEDWPKRPINLVVPYKAGGGTDAYARAISAAAEGILDVPVVVVNKPGSGGLNGANAVVGARPCSLRVLCRAAVGFPFPKTATSTSMCAWLWPSLATDIFGKGNPTPSSKAFQLSLCDSFSSIESIM